MKLQDLRKKNEVEMKKLLEEFLGELRDFRFGMSGGAKTNVRRARTLRRSIARIKTILGEKK